MQHFYFFLEVGPDTDPVLIGKMKTDERLAGIEEGKDFVLERTTRSPSPSGNVMQTSAKTQSAKYRIEEVLHGARMDGGLDSEVTRVLLRRLKDLPEVDWPRT